MTDAARKRWARARGEGTAQLGTYRKIDCERCGKKVGANAVARHRRNCITSLAIFLEEYADVLTYQPDTGCLIWSGRLVGHGYPGLGNGRRVTRVLLELFLQRPLDGKFACHTCDTPTCVNWWHLWPGTHQENMDDMVAKRRARGSSK